VTLEVKVLLALVLFSCLLAMLVMGPRAPLVKVKPGPWLAGMIAAEHRRSRGASSGPFRSQRLR
jgi:hypothetical protein